MTYSDSSGKSIELIYKLRGLAMAGAILHIGAHPDDEDVGLMSYVAHKFGIRIVYWSATRGEGGQNTLGIERQESLGVYRTWESQAVRAVDGGEVLFGPFYDFGYSKSGEETLNKWGGREVVTREVVRAIRLVQPQIVISRWTGQSTVDGHGHHQAIGSVTQSAFKAAGNPVCFPELQEHGLTPWQAQKLFFSTGKDWQPGEEGSMFGVNRPELENERYVRIDTGELDPVTDRTYQEQAWIGFNNHKTQAMGFVPKKDPFFYYYAKSESLVAETHQEGAGFFDGLDPTLTGLADYPGDQSAELRQRLDAIKSTVGEAVTRFQSNDAVNAGKQLLAGARMLETLSDDLFRLPLEVNSRELLGTYLQRKKRDFEQVASQCMGLKLECLSNHARLTPGQQFEVSTRLWNLRDISLDDFSFSICVPSEWTVQPNNQPAPGGSSDQTSRFLVRVSQMADMACPYWLRIPRQSYYYNWPVGEPSAQAFDPPLVAVACNISFEDYHFTVQSEVVLREAFPAGCRELPIAVVPPISLHPEVQDICLQTGPTKKTLELQVVARSNIESSAIEGILRLIAPAQWRVEPVEIALQLGASGDSRLMKFDVTIPENTEAGVYALHYVVNCGGRDYDLVLKPVRMGAPGLPRLPDASTCIREQFISVPAVNNIHLVDVKFEPGLRYGYIRGITEDVLAALTHFDVDFHLIEDAELGYIDLFQFDAIIIGPNAYLMREELRKNAFRFPDYVRQGGTVIVQYQGYGYQKGEFVPYPFKYSQPHDRVTDEKAVVKVLDANHFIFKRPNNISSSDFDHWVHDRGMYFFGEWDRRYTTLLSCNDLGEDPKEGGLVLSSDGHGTYVYCAYSFFRQLPAGVPGAFRLFANLLAIPRAIVLARAEFLKSISLFSELDEEQLRLVAGVMTERWERQGAYLCHQGDEGDEMYIIISGEVDIITEISGRRDETILTATTGRAIGEFQVLSKGKRSAAMKAKSDIHFLVIDGSEFRDLMHRYPVISDKMIHMLVELLVATNIE